MAVAAGMADTLAAEALLEVVKDPYASQTNVVRAAEAVWARAPVRVGGAAESSYRTSPAATGSQGPLPGQVYSTSQSETPEHTFDAASAAPVASEAPSVPEARLEDYAWLEWKRLHPGGRPYRPRRGRSRSPYADYDKLETG